MKLCPKCGSMLADDAQFCPDCGTSAIAQGQPAYTSVPRQPAQQPVQPQMQSNYAVPQGSPAPQAWYSCRHCSAMIPFDGRTPLYNCPVCGKPLAGETKAATTWPVGRILCLLSILVTFAGSFLPFFTYSVLGITYNFTLWDDKFIDDAVILSIILALCLLVVVGVKNTKGTICIIGGALVLYGMYVEYSGNRARLTNMDAGILGKMDMSNLLSPGMGFYIMVLGCIGMIVSSIVLHVTKKS